VFIVLVVQDIADKQHDGLIAMVLPPVGGPAGLGPDVAGVVHNRHGAVAGVFDDLTFGDVDDRGPITVTVPRDYSARLNRQLAEPKLALPDVGRLLFQVSLMLAGSFSRSIAASVVSVTPLPA
jgi:hypothetical protein